MIETLSHYGIEAEGLVWFDAESFEEPDQYLDVLQAMLALTGNSLNVAHIVSTHFHEKEATTSMEHFIVVIAFEIQDHAYKIRLRCDGWFDEALITSLNSILDERLQTSERFYMIQTEDQSMVVVFVDQETARKLDSAGLIDHDYRLGGDLLLSNSNTVPSIEISEEGILLDGAHFQLPVSIDTLSQLFGTARCSVKKYASIYTWDDLGLFANSKDGKLARTLEFSILTNNKDWDVYPKQQFKGSLNIDGIPYQNLEVKRKNKNDDHFSFNVGRNSIFLSIDDEDKITEIEIGVFKAPEPLKDPNKYELHPIEGDKILFKDFNFKLCIIGILMYQKELIHPVFDVYEFAERYTARTIDVAAEGYDIIPEVKAWFEQLEIGVRFAREITEIQQDGGDEIYLHLFPFWSGETDEFNIQSFEDIVHFPNLKKIELFHEDNKVLRETNEAFLLEHGVEIV